MIDGAGGSPPRHACWAPRAALYFRPDGYVSACCASSHTYGRVTGPGRRSLQQMWESAEAEALRRSLDAEDYTLGCWECGAGARAGRRPATLAATFDRYADRPAPGRP